MRRDHSMTRRRMMKAVALRLAMLPNFGTAFSGQDYVYLSSRGWWFAIGRVNALRLWWTCPDHPLWGPSQMFAGHSRTVEHRSAIQDPIGRAASPQRICRVYGWCRWVKVGGICDTHLGLQWDCPRWWTHHHGFSFIAGDYMACSSGGSQSPKRGSWSSEHWFQ
jgi:hypothetical protein